MIIDFNHWRGTQIADETMHILNQKRVLQVIEMLKPKFSKDGNQYCYLYGDLPNDCVIGFGNTAWDAACDFVQNYFNQKA